ncbi:MAG: hypothetical protein AAF497_26230 [Planctomycetota bacterium]
MGPIPAKYAMEDGQENGGRKMKDLGPPGVYRGSHANFLRCLLVAKICRLHRNGTDLAMYLKYQPYALIEIFGLMTLLCVGFVWPPFTFAILPATMVGLCGRIAAGHVSGYTVGVFLGFGGMILGGVLAATILWLFECCGIPVDQTAENVIGGIGAVVCGCLVAIWAGRKQADYVRIRKSEEST